MNFSKYDLFNLIEFTTRDTKITVFNNFSSDKP